MDFISNRKMQVEEMLKTIGIASVEELFSAIPSGLRLPKLHEDDGLSEHEGLQLMQQLAEKNSFAKMDSYLGAGAYSHHVPALVQAVCSKSEFLTSYTPYQAEVSQGILQAIFEFQSVICALTGMDAANASVYDGGSACAEALLMGLRIHSGKTKVAVSAALNPLYRSVVDQYLASHQFETVTLPMGHDGTTDMQALSMLLDSNTAAVLVQSPNFLGAMENVKDISSLAKAKDALVVQCANPLSYGLYASAGENGADIAVGDCQPLGLALNFGGPYAGYMACKQELIRQLPGRIVGETTDKEGKRGFVLTLQAREQHIRREKATSNICTNQALAALAVLVTSLWYGKEGMQKLALANYQRAAYLKDMLFKTEGIQLFSTAPFFNEFAIAFAKPLAEIIPIFRQHGIEPGLPLGSYYPHLSNYLLVAVTETKSKKQLDRYCAIAKQAMECR